MTANWLTPALALLTTLAAGGLVGTVLTYLRLVPKSSAEARSITAAAIDKDWARFQREIDRLVKRCEAAEEKAEQAITAFHQCEEEKIRLHAELAQKDAYLAAEGEARKMAAGVVALDRQEMRR